jgi:hypothetical protein
MSIHFLYIGRDENTLKDRLKLQPLMDQLPKEMNYSSISSRMGPASANGTSAGIADFITKLNITDMLHKYNIDPAMAKLMLGPILPSNFDFNDPFAHIPFDPPNMERIQAQMAKFGMSSPFARPSAGKGPLSAAAFKGMLANFVPPEKLNDITMSTDLSTLINGLPNDTRLDKIFVPGGIITSEMEEVMEHWFKSQGMKSPLDHAALSRRELVRRTIAELT